MNRLPDTLSFDRIPKSVHHASKSGALPVIVYLLRHGKAEPAAPGSPDSHRTLTESGRAEVRDLADLFVGMGIRPDRIFCSPLRRAQQTAKDVSERAGAKIETTATLRPHGEPEAVEDLLMASSVLQKIMLIGHQPLLGVLVWRWTHAEVPLYPGSLAVIELVGPRPAGGRLVGLYEPYRLLTLTPRIPPRTP